MRVWASVAVILGLSVIDAPAGAQCDPEFDSVRGLAGTAGIVWTSTYWDPDGPGPLGEQLIVGGSFIAAGDDLAANVARWDGDQWHPMGNGIDVGRPRFDEERVVSLVEFGGTLYASAKVFDREVAVHAWNGSNWIPVAGGAFPAGPLVVHQGQLIVAGGWGPAPGPAVDFLNTSALVDGRWQPLGDAFLASSEFVVSDGELLYAYGIFRLEDGDPVSRMATWDGLEWTIFPNAPDWSSVRAMVLHDGELYLGGEGRDSQGALAVFRDGAWNEIALPPGDRVYALASIDGRLVVARLFATDSDAIIELDGGSWRRFRNIEADSGFHLHSAGGRVVVGGSSLIHQQQPGDNVMVHREDTWHVLGTKSVPGGILHLGVDGDALLIGSFGLFPDVGRVSLVARYDGTTFSPVVDDGSADVLLSQVYTTLAEGDRLYIGGRFVGDGDRWSTCVTMVEDGRWVPMDRGLNNNVNRILRYGDDLLAVGAFSSNYDEPVVTVARWNGTNWEQFGDGRLSGTATDAIVFEDRLVLCGTTLEGDYPDGGIHRIAYWDESVGRWRELGTDGLDHSPLEIAERDGSLYVLASNPSRGTKRVMRLEDNRWEYFTDPIDGRWGTFAWYKGQVYVGSWGGGSSGLSRWEGDRWFEFGDRFLSTSLDVREIQVANGELWIAGGFTGVDDIVSPNLIRLRCGCEADFDADGELTIFDYLAFFNALEMGETAADLDGDGAFTVLDFQAFQQAFVAGCP